jgi:hypothetical protein
LVESAGSDESNAAVLQSSQTSGDSVTSARKAQWEARVMCRSHAATQTVMMTIAKAAGYCNARNNRMTAAPGDAGSGGRRAPGKVDVDYGMFIAFWVRNLPELLVHGRGIDPGDGFAVDAHGWGD